MAMLRLVLDVNVWVASFLAAARGRDETCCQQLVQSAIAGQCRIGPLVSFVSLPMLDTLQIVLERNCGFSPGRANAARNIAEGAGTTPLPPMAVLGGGIQPMLDREDIGVLETALAARAALLVTNNIEDFARGPRSCLDAEFVRRADVLHVRHPMLQDGLVIATPFAAKAWLIDGHPPPPGLLRAFRANPYSKT